MAIGRVAGPMLLSELDRQGIDLTFTTNSSQLVGLDFTNFRMLLKGGSSGPFVFNVNGNAAVGNVVLENGAIVTSQGLNQNLTLQANGIANVTVINANVISGRVDGTVIGGINPRPATFTYMNANVLATMATANVSNLRANLIAFTAPNNQIIMDNPTLRFYNANNSMVVDNLTVLQAQTFTTLDSANVVIRNSVPTAIAFMAANNWVKTNSSLTYSEANNMVSTGNIRLTGPNTNQLLFLDASDNKFLKGTRYLTFDGTNLRANGITRLGDVNIFNNIVSTAGVDQDLILAPDGAGVISAADHNIRNVASPTAPSDAATKSYVDGLITISTASTSSIYQFQTRVQALDDNNHTANITFAIEGVEQGRIESGLVNWQDININDATISTQAGPLILSPYNNERVILDTPKSLGLPVGNSAERPTPGLEYVGDFRFNTELGTVEWFDGTQWENPANSTVYSQTIIPDGVNATFTLNDASTTEAVLVNFNGVIQRPSTTYSVLGDQITFSSVPLVTDIIEIRFFNGTVAQATNPIVADRSYSNVGVTATTIDSWYINTYRAAKYTYVAKTIIGNNYETGDLHVVHDSLEGFHSSTFVSKTGSSMITWTLTNDPVGVMNVKAQGTHADVQVKFHAIYLTDPAV
jgi:hypothetical protein